MKAFVQRLKTKPRYSKAFEWVKLISMVGSVQVLVQAISFVSGIIILRMLPTGEYALYTLANTMLGTMVVLADGGISTGVMAQGAKVFQDRTKLGIVTVTGFDLRRKFAIGSAIIAIPVLIYLLRDNHASWAMSIMLVLSILPAFLFSLTGNLLEIILKIRQDIAPLQKIRLFSNAGRLAVLSCFIFIFPFAYIAILAAAIPQLWANMQMRKKGVAFADLKQKPDARIRRHILGIVARILPGAIYFCVSGQISIWLISVFGSTKNIAEVGALSKLAQLLTIFMVIFGTLITPRFARLKNDPHLLRKRFLQIIGGLFLLSSLVICTFMLFPTQFLWILGNNYANLHYELILVVTSSCLGMIAGSTYSLYSNRGWAINPILSVSIGVLSIIVGAILLRNQLSTLSGILSLDIFVVGISALMHISYGLLKIGRNRESKPVLPVDNEQMAEKMDEI